MKVIGSIILFITILSAKAEIPDHGNFCYADSCSNPQMVMWDFYKELDQFNIVESQVFSGDCFHSSPIYSNEVNHHGVILIDRNGKDTHMGGKFSFFAKKNPYKNWDIERARADFTDIYSKEKRLTVTSKFAYIDLNPGELPIMRYWFKSTGDADTLMLIGTWGASHSFICELRAN
ncbi:hypothetical protein BMS_1733 [Halobacteriovorax marinus SJ]|uniref:Uncharacterized protein n=1 Tax=Halobacteriovorax marinus (strain ATCC BAA-682 / DSM 15412 / SJ) TaxID=862908 RepID=E1X1H2_HALMS|nr:hypothetical protein [Halobacteriovorax marinus]CBW26563.1 hypothetical protein BMS_1733 [Halobacteriovorax marinus SJ]